MLQWVAKVLILGNVCIDLIWWQLSLNSSTGTGPDILVSFSSVISIFALDELWSAELGEPCLHDSFRHHVLLGCSDLVFKTSGIYIYVWIYENGVKDWIRCFLIFWFFFSFFYCFFSAFAMTEARKSYLARNVETTCRMFHLFRFFFLIIHRPPPLPLFNLG